MAGGSATQLERAGGGGHVDLRLAKDKDAHARKKGVVQLFTPAVAAEPSLESGLYFHVALSLGFLDCHI